MPNNDLISRAALIDVIERYANEPVKLNDRRWNTRCTAIIADMIGAVKTQSTVDAIPVEWLWRYQSKMLNDPRTTFEECAMIGNAILAWRKEQEAR